MDSGVAISPSTNEQLKRIARWGLGLSLDQPDHVL